MPQRKTHLPSATAPSIFEEDMTVLSSNEAEEEIIQNNDLQKVTKDAHILNKLFRKTRHQLNELSDLLSQGSRHIVKGFIKEVQGKLGARWALGEELYHTIKVSTVKTEPVDTHQSFIG